MIQMLSRNIKMHTLSEWADILGQGTYTVQEDNSEWDEKAPTPDLFENED
jgi:hypothetical protein